MELYKVNINNKLDEKLKEKLLSCVSAEKRNKINGYKNEADKLRSLMSETLIRSIICNKYKINNNDILYEYNIYGKPELKGKCDFFFNISHSGSWVFAGIDSKPIGVDIEEIILIDYISISKRFFTEDECRWLLSQNVKNRIKCFYKLWTIKESYLKMIGKGLSVPLNSFSIIFDHDDNVLLKHTDNSKIEANIKLYDVGGDYTIAVCSKKENLKPDINIVSYDDIFHYITF